MFSRTTFLTFEPFWEPFIRSESVFPTCENYQKDLGYNFEFVHANKRTIISYNLLECEIYEEFKSIRW